MYTIYTLHLQLNKTSPDLGSISDGRLQESWGLKKGINGCAGCEDGSQGMGGGWHIGVCQDLELVSLTLWHETPLLNSNKSRRQWFADNWIT